MEDLESLKNENTISMNSICKLYDKTEWRPTYFAVQDNLVFEKLQELIRKHKEVPVFISDNIPGKFKREKEWIEFPTDTKYHSYDILRKNITPNSVMTHTILFMTAIQLHIPA